jgi:hypothetical protein
VDAPNLEHLLLDLEERLLRPRSRAEVAQLLEEDFVEFGQSGQVYDRDETLAALFDGARASTSNGRVSNLPPSRKITEFKATLLASGIAWVTYRLVEARPAGAVSLRSSIWRQSEGRWRIVFHQGTAAREGQA